MNYSKIQRGKTPAAVKQIRMFKLYAAGLRSFIDAQKDGAMDNLYLVLGNKAKIVNLKIPLAFIIGDNQGGDGIAGRICFYGISAKRISRCCDATADNYEDMTADSCNFLSMEDIVSLVNNEEWGDLEDLYQAQCWNPFFEIDYGSNPSGVFVAACPPEGLHALEQGIFKHLLEEILGNYLKPEQIALLDRVVQSWVSKPRQRLFRSSNSALSPRLMFKDGISSLKNTPGCDRAGMVFALAIASHTRDGLSAFSKLDDDVPRDITYALEMLMCYWAWLKQDQYWSLHNTEQYEVVKTAVSTLLHELVTCIPRLRGNGWNIPKVHEQLHVPFYILRYGAHRNLHTGTTERNHIDLSKKPARRTQMRADTFDAQVANRLVDKFVVDLADFTMSEAIFPEKDIIVPPPDGVSHNSAVFDMVFWSDINGTVHADVMTPAIHSKFVPCSRVLHTLSLYCMGREDVSRHNGVTQIRCVTELRINNHHLRANPVESGGAWFDNIELQGETDEHGIDSTTVGNLKFMFFFPQYPDDWLGIIHPAYGYKPPYSVITRMYRMEYEDDPNDILGSCDHIDPHDGSWVLDDEKMSLDSSPNLIVVHLSDVISHVLMIPYHDQSKFMIGVLNQSLWADQFVSY